MLILLLAAAGTPAAGAAPMDAILYRPMLADPRESLIHLRVASFTQDFRYGSDPMDSTTVGGWNEDVSGVGFDVGAGKIFRAPVWQRIFGFRPAWRGYQLTASGLVSASLDRISAQLVTVADYQFGGGLEAQWSGAGDAGGVASFARAVWSTRTALFHRSAHLGDELVGQSNFGRNQTGPGAGQGWFAHPAPRRMTLSHEVLQQLVAIEWAPGGGITTWRTYAGGELPVDISGIQPPRRRSPSAQLGLEFRSRGNAAAAASDPLSRRANRALGFDAVATQWFAAADLRLARPFNFASCDNPDGEGEAWTPSLWTDCPCGREFRRYAGSWHGMVGAGLFAPPRRDTGAGGRIVGSEAVLTLDWFYGYSNELPFLDSRRRSHPRWYVVPGLTMHF